MLQIVHALIVSTRHYALLEQLQHGNIKQNKCNAKLFARYEVASVFCDEFLRI